MVNGIGHHLTNTTIEFGDAFVDTDAQLEYHIRLFGSAKMDGCMVLVVDNINYVNFGGNGFADIKIVTSRAVLNKLTKSEKNRVYTKENKNLVIVEG